MNENKADVEKMLELAKDTDFYTTLLLAVYVGLRRGELVALKWSDIDLEKGIIHVRHNAVMVGGELVIKAPKSAAGTRDVAIGNKLVTELKKTKLQYNKNKIACRDFGRRFILFAVYGLFVDGDSAVYGFVFLNAGLSQKLKLGIEGAFVILGDICDFVKKFGVKSNARLNFVCSHDNTSLTL